MAGSSTSGLPGRVPQVLAGQHRGDLPGGQVEQPGQREPEDQPEVGIIFSGGVDSVMIAQIARDLGADITCYTGGFEKSADVQNAQRVARDLDFDVRSHTLTEEKIDAELERGEEQDVAGEANNERYE
jgi:hypothetical protein